MEKKAVAHVPKVGFVARYFLRWLAIESNVPHSDPSTPYFAAMLRVTYLVVLFPSIGVISFVGLATLKLWAKTETGYRIAGSKYLFAFGMLAISVVIGRLILRSTLIRYERNPSSRYLFDTEQDRRIAKLQQAVVYFFCGIVMPGIGLLITYLTDSH